MSDDMEKVTENYKKARDKKVFLARQRSNKRWFDTAYVWSAGVIFGACLVICIELIKS